jgi:hypothetical protein
MEPSATSGWMALAVVGAVLVVCLVMGAADAGAPPPPIAVEGEIRVATPCVVFGHKIDFDGAGFAPETPVRVFVPALHYTLPGLNPSKTVTSNAEGEIDGFLEAPGGPAAKWEWMQEEIAASGLDRGGLHKGESFDLVVIGSPSICRVLDRQ